MNAMLAFRKAHGLTLAEAAEKIGGVSVGSLSRIESGEQWPSAELALRIAQATDGVVTPNDLLALKTNRTSLKIEAKRIPFQVSLDPKLLEEAQALDIDLTAEIEKNVRENISRVEAARWKRDNADAITAWNRELEENGLWSDGLRTF
jgi:antitoxin CcdA